MVIQMYDLIEQQFRKISYYQKAKKFITISVGIIILLYLVMLSLSKRSIILQIIYSLFMYLFILTLFYLYIFLHIRKQKNLKVEKWYKFCKNIILYKQCINDEDVINLGIIFEKNKINSLEKLSEVLRHYQTLTTRNVKKSNETISFLSLIISLIALFSTDVISKNIENVYFILSILLFSLFLYLIVLKITNYMNLMFGKDELYKRIENISAEIYMEKLLG